MIENLSKVKYIFLQHGIMHLKPCCNQNIKNSFKKVDGNFTFDKVLASGINYYRPKGLTVDDFNGDGYFDTWHITGVNQLTGTLVYIYDRYGDDTDQTHE